MELFYDTETSGLAQFKSPYWYDQQPWVVQLGAILSDKDIIYAEFNCLIQPRGRTIEPGAYKVHGIDVKMTSEAGIDELHVIDIFTSLGQRADTLVCHNVAFDQLLMAGMVSRAYTRVEADEFIKRPTFCTMQKSTNLCKLPGRYGKFKWPKLQELHEFLFNEKFIGAHDAMADIRATRRCYYEMKRREEDA